MYNDLELGNASNGVTITAEEVMTLEASTGTVKPVGLLTLVAGSGLWLHDDLTIATANKALVINVDFESEGDGTLTVVATKTVASNKSDVTITAWDIMLDGSLNAGTLGVSLHGSETGQTIGLNSKNDMQVSLPEMSRITCEAGLEIGHDGTISVNGIDDASSDQIGTLTLLSTRSADMINFVSFASSFNKGIVLNGSNGVVLSQSVTTKNKPVAINAGHFIHLS